MQFAALANSDYSFYVEYTHNGRWKPARHNLLVCDSLQKVESGEIDRLMIFMPPRHGKSMTATETFPSYFIGKNPERRVIVTSYADTLAQKFGNANKKKIEEYGQGVFGLSVDSAVSAKTNWNIEGHEGGMISAGIMGGITGFGADLLLIDDPIKTREEADSPTYREKLWDEWENTLLTRLHAGGRIIIILTRWHTDDLAGRLLAREGRTESGGKWHVIDLAAEALEPHLGRDDSETIFPDMLGREPGEPLWPDGGYDKAWIAQKKAEVGSYTWSALYQQRPRPRDAVKMFHRGWFQIVDDYPRDTRKKVRYWDFAATEAEKGKDPDFTAGCLMVEKGGQYWIVDMRRFRLSPKGNEDTARVTGQLDGRTVAQWQEQEPGSSGKTVVSHFKRNVFKGLNHRAEKVTGDKGIRAMPLSAAAEAGNVFLVRGAWNEEFLKEIDDFGCGALHDDQCFVAGTKIATLFGDKPIEAVKAGEYVITPFGLRRVLFSGQTGTNRVISNIGLSATPKHKVFTRNGFASLESIGGVEECNALTLRGLIKWTFQKLYVSTVLNTGLQGREDITLASQIQTQDGAGLKGYMLRFMNFIQGIKSLKVLSFIIKTVIHLTMTLVIWNVYQLANMVNWQNRKTMKSNQGIWHKLGRLLQYGTSRKKDENGTKIIVNWLKSTQNVLTRLVKFAVNNSSEQDNQNTVPAGAWKSQERLLLEKNVPFAEQNFRQKSDAESQSTQNEHVAVIAEECLQNKQNDPRAVYNLTVDKDHVYYANGVLVSNCDAASGAFRALNSAISKFAIRV